MPFNRPTLQQIIERSITDVESRLVDVSARLKRSVINALIRSHSAVAHGLHGHLDWLSKQIIPDTAEDDMLDRHADWWGINRLAASSATGNITFTGTSTTVIPAGTVIQRADGEQYTTDADGTITAGTVDIAVTAITEGQDSNTDASVSVSLVVVQGGVDSTATVATGGLTGGADQESNDALRLRLKERVQQTPHGGAVYDYVAWAKETAGVTRAWAYGSWSGAGSVGVFFVRDDDASLIPDAGEVTTVQTYIDTVRPVTAAVTVYAPTEQAQAMTIQLAPNTTVVQGAVEDALDDLFRTGAEVEGGNGEGTILISHIREAVSIGAGENDNVMVSPVANITLADGEIATLGAITWQAIT